MSAVQSAFWSAPTWLLPKFGVPSLGSGDPGSYSLRAFFYGHPLISYIPTWQSDTAKAVNWEIHAKEEMMFMIPTAQALGSE